MKKILLSLSMIVFVGAVVVGATGAFFSDTAVSSGNTFSSGTMDLQLSNDNSSFSDSVSATFGGIDLYPGQDLPADQMDVQNSGSISGHHVNLTVTLLTGVDSDLAKNILFQKIDGDNGLRFGATTNGADSDSLVAALLGVSPGSGDYVFTDPAGVPVSNIDGIDGTPHDTELSLNELAKFGKIRITPGSNNQGVAATTIGHLWINPKVGTGLTTQGETVDATFTWELQQDASQQ